jgi:tRNA 2-selenouridine synthase
MLKRTASVDQLSEFDTIIDVRSPAEYIEDHLPEAQSCPVLNNEERIRVGTLYKQVSAFEAKKLGATLVSRNIAEALEANFLNKPKHWRPLVYCWRGGQRSGAFTHVLREIGWDAHQLAGGYKNWRRHVLTQLETIADQFEFRVISGATGSGKSRLLEALSAQGAQVLHLEQLAAHKGSVLGSLPGETQPTQKGFDTLLYAALGRLSKDRPVFVEAESRKIGQLHLPEALIAAIRQAPCLRLDASLDARIKFLLGDYGYAIEDPAWLLSCIDRLRGMQSRETLSRWSQLVAEGEFEQLVEALLTQHYDPLYQRSQNRNFTTHGQARLIEVTDLSSVALTELAQRLITDTSICDNLTAGILK